MKSLLRQKGDTGQHVSKPGARINAVQLCGLDQAIHVTETLEVIPRQWKITQTVRKKFACRSCEAITQPPAPFHPIMRGRAGPHLLATILEAKFGQQLPLNRLSETFAREGNDVTREIIQHSAEMEPPPAGDLETGEIRLP